MTMDLVIVTILEEEEAIIEVEEETLEEEVTEVTGKRAELF